MFRFKAVVLTRDLSAGTSSSWPFMLSFRDGRCDAKDGVATDRESLLPSELGQSRAAVWGAATLRRRGCRGCQREMLGTVASRASFFLSHESNGLPDPPWRLVAAGP